MLGLRLVVALAGIPLLLVAAYLGGLVLLLLVALLVTIGLVEFYHLASRLRLQPVVPAGIAGGLLIVFLAYFYREIPAWLGTGILTGILLLFLAFFPRVSPGDAGITLLGIWYIGGLLAYLLLLRYLPGGPGVLILALVLTWANDSGAYFCGRLLGHRHPWPHLSPGKTVAGAIGGVAVTVATALIAGTWLVPALGLWHRVGLAVLASLAAQAGDLIESGCKRQAGVKDSGWLLPGHGGILDRFDSLLLVAPVVYYYLAFFL